MVTESGIYILFGEGYRITYNPSTLYTFNYKKMRDPEFRFDEDADEEETSLYIQEKDSTSSLTEILEVNTKPVRP